MSKRYILIQSMTVLFAGLEITFTQDDFDELGIDSMQVSRVVSMLEEKALFAQIHQRPQPWWRRAWAWVTK
jgi:hypothetical protein